MGNNLIPVYREREFYTLFYDQHQNVIYKLQHRNKSFGLFFMFILAMTWFSESLDAFYINYKNPLLNIVIFIFAIGITYYVSNRFYNAYYQQESKRELILDKDEMKEYAIKGLKQLKIEFYSSIVSLPISFFFYTIFFITSKVRPMVIGCIFLGVTFIFAFMKPLSRKRILRQFKDGIY